MRNGIINRQRKILDKEKIIVTVCMQSHAYFLLRKISESKRNEVK